MAVKKTKKTKKAKAKKGSARPKQYTCGTCQELGHNSRTCGQ